MDKNIKETLLKAAEYSEAKQEKSKKKFHFLFKLGAFCYLLFALLKHSEMALPMPECIRGFMEGFFIGSAIAGYLLGCIMTSSCGEKICEFKKRLIKR